MKPSIVGLALVLFLIVVASFSWSAGNSTGTGGSGTAAEPEPVTGSASQPNSGSETAMHAPFSLYDTGPLPWSYDQLETDELKAQVDRGRDVTGWSATHDAYATAVQSASAEAQAEAAQHQLGIEDPGATGVVP